MSFVWNPEDQYPCKVNPPKFPNKGVDLDEFQEMTLLSCVNLEEMSHNIFW